MSTEEDDRVATQEGANSRASQPVDLARALEVAEGLLHAIKSHQPSPSGETTLKKKKKKKKWAHAPYPPPRGV